MKNENHILDIPYIIGYDIYEKKKHDKENLTKEERNNLKKAVELLELSLEKGSGK